MKSKSPHKAAEPSVVGITDEQGIPFEPNGSRSAEQDIIAVHKARLADWSPSAVTAASATADGTVLAVARESGNVELWQTEHWTISAVTDFIAFTGYIVQIPGTRPDLLHCI